MGCNNCLDTRRYLTIKEELNYVTLLVWLFTLLYGVLFLQLLLKVIMGCNNWGVKGMQYTALISKVVLDVVALWVPI